MLIRDVAYGMLPKSVRCQKHVEVGEFIREKAGERGDAFVGMVAEHYARAAALGSEAGLDADGAGRAADARRSSCSRPPATRPPPSTPTPRRSSATPPRSSSPSELDAGDRARIGEKQGDVALRMGRVDAAVAVWERCLEYHRGEEDLARVADLHRKIGAALWHKGERRASIDNYQRGIDLLKDGEPCIELVRLYEEAASLYMHTGDNMLAIYASEKALRLAERLDEARAASRAHGIFGRVFGRIGDSEKARENLERSVALARESDRGEAVRALLTLGYHLEVSEADYEGAAEAYREALELAQEVGDLPSQVELHASLGQLAVERADWDEVERATEASAGLAEREGLHGKLCFPFVMRGVARLARRATGTPRPRPVRRAHELGEQVGRSEVAFNALLLAGADPARQRRPGRRRDRARPGARHLRARRADRPVGRGDLRAARSCSRSPAATSRPGPPPRRPSGSPTGCTTRSATPPRRRPPAPAPRTPRRPAKRWTRRASAGASSAGRSTPPAACSSWAGSLAESDPERRRAAARARPARSTRRSTCPRSPRARASWSRPDDGLLEAAGA